MSIKSIVLGNILVAASIIYFIANYSMADSSDASISGVVEAQNATTVGQFSAEAKSDNAYLKLSWTHPTTRTDGTELKLAEITSTTVMYECNGNKGATIVPAPKNEFIGGLPGAGQTCSYTLATTDTENNTSAPSDPFVYVGGIVQPPSPPKWLLVPAI